MIGRSRERSGATGHDAAVWVVEPFLHVDEGRIYNPLTHRSLVTGDAGFAEVKRLSERASRGVTLTQRRRAQLIEEGWIVSDQVDVASRFYLRYASLEANTGCNQACYFCPVSISPREDYLMPMDFYEDVARQLATFSTLEGVSMVQYNEPTADKRFLDQVRILREYDLPTAVVTNGSGLTPHRVDEILAMGGLLYLSVNLSTLDAARYAQDRGADHLRIVLRNLDYLRDRPLAPRMVIAVLGTGTDEHRRDHAAISQRFENSRFEVEFHEVMDRAGSLQIGRRPKGPVGKLCGCEQTGSRPLQWIHITPRGKCVLCCQDYHEKYAVGDLHEQTIEEVLSGPAMASLRRMVYGLDEAPADFICRKCIYARVPDGR